MPLSHGVFFMHRQCLNRAAASSIVSRYSAYCSWFSCRGNSLLPSESIFILCVTLAPHKKISIYYFVAHKDENKFLMALQGISPFLDPCRQRREAATRRRRVTLRAAGTLQQPGHCSLLQNMCHSLSRWWVLKGALMPIWRRSMERSYSGPGFSFTRTALGGEGQVRLLVVEVLSEC